MGFTYYLLDRHTFWVGQAVLRKCTWCMKSFNWKIWSVKWEAREFKWGSKQVKRLQYQQHQSIPKYLIQQDIQSKTQVKKNQSRVWKRRRWTQGTRLWHLTWKIKASWSILQRQQFKFGIWIFEERDTLVLEDRVERNKNTGKGWIRREVYSLELRKKEMEKQEYQILQGRM